MPTPHTSGEAAAAAVASEIENSDASEKLERMDRVDFASSSARSDRTSSDICERASSDVVAPVAAALEAARAFGGGLPAIGATTSGVRVVAP
jgi:hypothetical protein